MKKYVWIVITVVVTSIVAGIAGWWILGSGLFRPMKVTVPNVTSKDYSNVPANISDTNLEGIEIKNPGQSPSSAVISINPTASGLFDPGSAVTVTHQAPKVREPCEPDRQSLLRIGARCWQAQRLRFGGLRCNRTRFRGHLVLKIIWRSLPRCVNHLELPAS